MPNGVVSDLSLKFSSRNSFKMSELRAVLINIANEFVKSGKFG